MALDYLVLRSLRHFMPDALARYLLKRSWIIHPGLETEAPREAVDQYQRALAEIGQTLKGKRILLFGYGGYFATACALLDAAAAHVVAWDILAPDDQRNRSLCTRYSDYLSLDEHDGRLLVNPYYLTVFQGDIRRIIQKKGEESQIPLVDLVLSSSVFEHLEDVEGIVQALAAVTSPQGYHLHFIDLRDHYFKYPFEMLCYSERVWRSWLDPGSHLNRYRSWDYQRAFEKHFENITVTVLGHDIEAFERTRRRIQAEFLSGDVAVDAATAIRVLAYGRKISP